MILQEFMHKIISYNFIYPIIREIYNTHGCLYIAQSS